MPLLESLEVKGLQLGEANREFRWTASPRSLKHVTIELDASDLEPLGERSTILSRFLRCLLRSCCGTIETLVWDVLVVDEGNHPAADVDVSGISCPNLRTLGMGAWADVDPPLLRAVLGRHQCYRLAEAHGILSMLASSDLFLTFGSALISLLSRTGHSTPLYVNNTYNAAAEPPSSIEVITTKR